MPKNIFLMPMIPPLPHHYGQRKMGPLSYPFITACYIIVMAGSVCLSNGDEGDFDQIGKGLLGALSF